MGGGSISPSLFYILFRFCLKTFLCLFQLSFTNNFIASQKEKHSCSMKRIKDNQYKVLFEEVGSLLFLSLLIVLYLLFVYSKLNLIFYSKSQSFNNNLGVHLKSLIFWMHILTSVKNVCLLSPSSELDLVRVECTSQNTRSIKLFVLLFLIFIIVNFLNIAATGENIYRSCHKQGVNSE